jgi:hypothetical protein
VVFLQIHPKLIFPGWHPFLEAANHNFQFYLSQDIELRIKDIKQLQL